MSKQQSKSSQGKAQGKKTKSIIGNNEEIDVTVNVGHRFKPGNHYWKLAKGWKKPKKYPPDKLLDKIIEFIRYYENSSVKAEKVFGTGKRMIYYKPRAMTIKAFCLYAGISRSTWYEYENDSDYSDIIKDAKNLFFIQKFESAAAGLLEQNIIARELSLPDRQDITSDDESFNFKPDLSKLSTEDLKALEEIYSKMDR